MKSFFVKPSVGDRLLMIPNRKTASPQTVEVTRVGRTWGSCAVVYDDKPSTYEQQFSLDSGFEKRGDYSPSWRLVTQEQLDAEERRRDLLAALEDLGLERRSYFRTTDWMTNEALEELLQVARKHVALAE